MADELVLSEALEQFCKDPTTCTARSLGCGNINDTYLVRSVTDTFVLQRISSGVFPDPLRVIENFHKITNHFNQKKEGSREQLQVASPVFTLGNRLFYRDSKGDFWRGQTYLKHKSCQVLSGPDQAFQVGKALAIFHRLVSDLDMQGFLDPLPGFHALPRYLEDYDREIQGVKREASEDFHFCRATIDRYRKRAAVLEKAKQAGILSTQPIHGDPKVDNFLFGEQGDVIGLLDLDTVATGLVHYDLGDCLRSCCNRVGEAGRDLSSVSFDMDFCRALLGGYFSGPDKLLAKEQRGYIFDGILLICFELGLRFFTDHLRGNPYFKVEQDGDNLLRALNQFRLADDIAEKEQEIRVMALSSGCR
ncbi:MAG: aminoglycoside phosphotransferase family protein [Desulfobulbaceae bacterium]|nr:aminoglycoside phosphotransferase family protein [Desulfobulbaceae bacterium]